MKARIGPGRTNRVSVGVSPQEKNILRPLLAQRTAAVVFDVGSYDGQSLLDLLSLLPGPPARAVAVEADPRNIGTVRARLGHAANVLCCAVSDCDGSATLRLSEHTNSRYTWTLSSTLSQWTDDFAGRFPHVRAGAEIHVPTRSLDSIAKELGIERADVVWADVEGAEGALVAGGQRLLARTDILVLEAMDPPIHVAAIPRSSLVACCVYMGFRLLAEVEFNIVLVR